MNMNKKDINIGSIDITLKEVIEKRKDNNEDDENDQSMYLQSWIGLCFEKNVS